MVKCTKAQVRRLKTALRWKGDPKRRQRIQMVLLREGGMTQPAIAEAMGASLSTVNRAHMAYDRGGLKALKSSVSEPSPPLIEPANVALSTKSSGPAPPWSSGKLAKLRVCAPSL